jgi:hypothetical protein
MSRVPARLRLLAAFLLPLLIGACATSGEGGVVGSGISSIVQGNVIEVRQAEAADGATIPTLIVSVDEAPGIETTTDDAGSFLLAGEFAGQVTIRFRDRATDESLGTLGLDIALGSTVVLRDVEIRRDLDVPVQLPPPLQLNLDGRVIEVDCAGAAVRVADEAAARNLFTLRLGHSTEIVEPDDTPRSCSDIRPGDPIRVEEGVVNLEDALIDAVKVRIAATEPTPEIIRVRRRGIVLRLQCGNNPRVSFQDSERTDIVRAVLSAETEIVCGTDRPQPCDCADMEIGDLIDVTGLRRLDGPEAILATRVQIQRNLEASFITTSAGDVERIDCGAEILRVAVREPSDSPREVTLALRLINETSYVCSGRRTCTCEEIGAGDRVQIEARVFIDQQLLPEAIAVTVLASPQVTRLSGEAVGVDCALGELSLRTAGGAQVRVQLTRATVFEFEDQEPTTCVELARLPRRLMLSGFVRTIGGERVVVAATIRVERETFVTRSPSPLSSFSPARPNPPTSTPADSRSPIRPRTPEPVESRTPARPSRATETRAPMRPDTPTPADSRSPVRTPTQTPAAARTLARTPSSTETLAIARPDTPTPAEFLSPAARTGTPTSTESRVSARTATPTAAAGGRLSRTHRV